MSLLVASLLNTMTDNLSVIIGIDFECNIIDVFNFLTVLINFESHIAFTVLQLFKSFVTKYFKQYFRYFFLQY